MTDQERTALRTAINDRCNVLFQARIQFKQAGDTTGVEIAAAELAALESAAKQLNLEV